MLDTSQRKAILLISGSIMVILFFHGLISFAGPALFSTPYDPSLYDGTRVSHEGIVEELRDTRTGGHTIAMVSGVKIFIPQGIAVTDLRIGGSVTVYGLLQTFDGDREIRIQRDQDIIPW